VVTAAAAAIAAAAVATVGKCLTIPRNKKRGASKDAPRFFVGRNSFRQNWAK